MRKPIIVGDWKMNKTMKETKEFMESCGRVLRQKTTLPMVSALLILH